MDTNSIKIAVARLAPDAREMATRQNPAVLLYRNGINITVRLRVESHVERAVRVQSRDVGARHA